MKEINIIGDVPKDVFYNGDKVFFKKNNSIFNIDKNLEEFLSFDFPFIIEKIDSEFLYIRTKDFLRKISLTDKSKSWDFRFKVIGTKQVIYINDNYFLIRENVKENDCIIVKGIFQSKIIWAISSKESYLFSIFGDENSVLLKEDNQIYLLNSLNGEYKWQHSFSELLHGKEIKQYGNIVVYQNRIFIYLADNNDSKKIATVSIDINSGKVVNVYKGFSGNLILSNNKIYVASYEIIKILDLINNEIIELDFENILKPLNLSIHWNSSVIQGNYLYFVDGHSYTTNKLGVLDLKSKKLVWNGEIKIEDDINNNIQKIKITDSRLYVHCLDDTLHVFEIE